MSKPEHTPSGSRGSEDETRTPDLTKRTSAEPTEKDAGQPGADRAREAEPERIATGRKPAGSGPDRDPVLPGGAGSDPAPDDAESGAAVSAEAEPEPEAAEAGGAKADLAKPAASKSAVSKSAASKPVASESAASESAVPESEPAEPAGPGKSGAAKADAGKRAGSARNAGSTSAAAKSGADASAEAEPAAEAATSAAAESVDADRAEDDAVEAASVKAASAKVDVVKADAAKSVSGKADAVKAEPAKADVTKAEPAKADAGKAGAGKADAGKGEAGRGGRGAVGKGVSAGAGPKGVTGDTAEDEGRLLARRYRLERVLGKGGMGTVWRAVDETLGRTVAVKELRFSSGVDEDEKRRLITRTLREAKAIARIRSGGAVTVFDVVDEDGRPWIVMELIEGSSLAEFIRDKGTLTPRRAAEVGLAVLDVLKAAHGEGILHRDVKPSNVLISNSGRVVLTDFGIAQVEGDPSVTSTGMLVGAPSYISPERARGQKPGPPADMWSLGGLLYAAVEGTPPYDKGSALATLTAVMTEPVDPPKNAGPLADVIYGLLVKDPARRLDDARARVMLTEVINAPEEEPAPPADETRVISLTAAKEAAEQAAATKAAEKAAAKAAAKRDREQRERAREALKAARKAAAAAVSTTAATGAEAPDRAGAASGAKSPAGSAASVPAGPSSGRPGAASLTDVMPRRTIALAIAAVVVALAVIGSLVAWMISGGDDEKGGKDAKNGGPDTKVSGSPVPGGSKGSDGKGSDSKGDGGTGGTGGTGQASGGTQGTGGSTPDPGQSTGSSGSGAGIGGSSGTPGTIPGIGETPGVPSGPGSLPAGYTTVTNGKYHFSIAMPDSFKEIGTAGANSGMKYARDDSSFPRIQVDYNKSPGSDARKAWAELAYSVAASSKGYSLKGLDTVDYRGYPTVADWVFEREQNGVRVRVLNRGFKVDDSHGYAIMITCAADQWDGAECTQLRNTAFDTFKVVD